MIGVDAAEKKETPFSVTAKFEELAGVRQFADGCLGALEFGVKPFFELLHRHVRYVTVIEAGEGEGKFGAELFQCHFGFAGLRQNEVGCLEHGRQIVHKRAGPVKNDVADHIISLTLKRVKDTLNYYHRRNQVRVLR